MQIATIVKQVVEVAAINPEAQAIIVACVPDTQPAVLREALEALSGIGQLPPVLLMAGEVALADEAGGDPTVGVFIGANQLAKLLELSAEELRAALLDDIIYRGQA